MAEVGKESIDLGGLVRNVDKFANDLSKIEGTEKSLKSLMNSVATLLAIGERLKSFAALSSNSDVMKYVGTLEKVMRKIESFTNIKVPERVVLPEVVIQKPTKTSAREQLISEKQARILERTPLKDSRTMQEMAKMGASRLVSDKEIQARLASDLAEYNQHVKDVAAKRRELHKIEQEQIEEAKRQTATLNRETKSVFANLSKLFKRLDEETSRKEIADRIARRAALPDETQEDILAYEELRRKEAERDYRDQKTADDARRRQKLAGSKLQAKFRAREVLRPAFPEIKELDKINTVDEVNKEIAARTNLVKVRDDEYKAVVAKVNAEKDPEALKAFNRELVESANRLKTAHDLKDAAKEKLNALREEAKEQRVLADEEKKRFEEKKREAVLSSKEGMLRREPVDALFETKRTIKDLTKEITDRGEILRQEERGLSLARERVLVAKDESELNVAIKNLKDAEERVALAGASKKASEEKLVLLREEEAQLKKNKKEALEKMRLTSDKSAISREAAQKIAEEKALVALNNDSLETIRAEIVAKKDSLELTREKIEKVTKDVELAKQKVVEAKNLKDAESAILDVISKKRAVAYNKTTATQEEADIKALQNVERIKVALQETDRLTSEISAKMKLGMSTGEIKENIALINNELKKIPESLRPERATALQEELKKAGLHTRTLGNNLEFVKTSFAKTKSEAAELSSQMFSLEKIMQRVSFVLTAKLSYVSFDRLFRTLKNLVSNFASFEDEMSKTFALVAKKGATAHADLMDTVKKAALEYRVELKSVSEALYQIVSAQFNAKDSTLVLDAAMKLAVGGFSEVKDAALALVQILNAFDLEARNAEHVADVMFETSRLGIITTQQYANEISKIASTASIFGLSIEDVSAAISTMTRNGVKVDHAFTSLNQLLMTIANPTEKARKVLDTYGVTLDMNTVRAQGLMGALMGLGKILKSEEAMLEIFKTRTGARAMFSLVQHEEEYLSDLVNMYSSVGVAQEAVNVRMRTTSALTKKLKSESEALSVEVGKRLQSAFRSTLDFAIGAAGGLRSGIELTTGAVKGLVATMVTLLAVQAARIFAQLIRGVKSFIAHLITAGGIARMTWAEITMGLSVVVGLLVTLWQTLEEVGKTSKELDLTRTFGLVDAEERLGKINKEIADLDANIQKMKGIDKLLSQFEELHKVQGKNTKAQEAINKLQEELAKHLTDTLKIQVSTADVETKLGELRTKLFETRIAQEKEIAKYLLRQQAIQSGKDARSVLTDRGKEVDKKPLYGQKELDEAFQEFSINVVNLSKNTKITNEQLLKAGKNIDTDILYERMDYVSKQSELGIARLKRELEDARQALQNIAVETLSTTISESSFEREKAARLKTVAALYEVKKKEKELQRRITQQDALSDNIANMRQTVLDVEVALAQFELSQIDSTYKQYEPLITEMLKGVHSAAGGAGRQVRDYVFEIVDKYIDLFRSVGFAVEDSYGDKLLGIQKKVAELKKDVYAIIPNQAVTDSLDTLGSMLQAFSTFDTVVKQRNKKIADVINNYERAGSLLTSVKGGERAFRDMAANLVSVGRDEGIPRIIALGEALEKMFEDGLEKLTETVEDYRENEFGKLLSKARNEEERARLSKEIMTLDKELFGRVSKMSINELKRFIDEETTKKSYKPYIEKLMRRRREDVGRAIKMLADRTSNYIEDIEKGIYSVSDLFGKVRKIMGITGERVSESDLVRVMSAVIAGNEKEMEKASKIINEKLVRPAEKIDGKENMFIDKTAPNVGEFLKLSLEEQEIYLKHFQSLQGGVIGDEFRKFIDDVNTELTKSKSGAVAVVEGVEYSLREFLSAQEGIMLSSSRELDSLTYIYEAMRQGYAKRLKRINLSKKTIDNFEDMGALYDELVGTGKIVGIFGAHAKKAFGDKSSFLSLSQAEQADMIADFIERAIKDKIPMSGHLSKTAVRPEKVAGISYEEVQGMEGYKNIQDSMDEAKAIVDKYDKQITLVSNVTETTRMTAKQTLELLLTFLEEDTELWSEISAILDSGDKTKMNEFIRRFLLDYKKTGDIGFGELFAGDPIDSMKPGEILKDFAKDKLQWGKGITMDEAYRMTVDEGLKLAEQALKQHYDHEIEMMQERNRRALELEKEKQDAMLANENMSSSEREAIQKKFAERQAKMQEEMDKKVAEKRRKQALTEMSITYAKGVAEVFIREVSTHGVKGLISAAALTALMSANYLVQRNMIAKQKFAEGGYTGTGYGLPDSTGQKPAGIVHEKELVIDRKTLARNFDPLMTMYAHMRKGMPFEDFMVKYMMGKAGSGAVGGQRGGLYAGGGYVRGSAFDNINVNVELGSMRVLDEVDLAVMVERGGKKRRFISG